MDGATRAIANSSMPNPFLTLSTYFSNIGSPGKKIAKQESRHKPEQLARRIPQKLAPVGRIGKKRDHECKQHAVVDVYGRAKVGPVRRPQAMVERKGVDQRRDEGPCIVVQRGLARELHEPRELHEGALRCSELEQRPKARLVEPIIYRGTAGVVDEDS